MAQFYRTLDFMLWLSFVLIKLIFLIASRVGNVLVFTGSAQSESPRKIPLPCLLRVAF